MKRRFPFKFKFNPKIAVPLLLAAGLGFFLLKDFVFKHEAPPAPVHLAGPAVAPKKIVQAKPKAPSKPIPVTPSAKSPRMAIVLDDWGNNYSLLAQALAIRRPLTVAVLPNLPFSRKISEGASNAGLGVILHMPMQPQSKQPLEPHTILTTTPDSDIRSYLDTALASVPQAEGINNHMGSAATSDLRVMRTVLAHLKQKGLFFLDSNVVPSTVGPRVAKELKIPYAVRDVFIDNDPTSASVKKQLNQAKNVALREGQVVVIGHDKKVTLAAIEEMVPEFEKAGIKLVLVKELLRKP